jgi:hypothetical protein
MPGFDNGTVYFENGVDPRGVLPIVNQMNVDGNLLIGSTNSPFVICNTLTSNSGMTIVNGHGTIALNSLVQTVTHTLTSTVLKTLAGIPITIVPAQGAHTIICPLRVAARFVYGGSNAFLTAPNVIIDLAGGTNIYNQIVMDSVSLIGTADMYTVAGLSDVITAQADTVLNNEDLVLKFATNATGNAADDNSLIVQVTYYISTLT